jgi:hypothetical protein
MANNSNLSGEELRKLFNVTKTPTQAANYWSSAGSNIANGGNPNAVVPIQNQPTTPQAPQNANVSFDFSGQPTLESLDQDAAMFAKAGYELRPDGSYGRNTNSAAQAPQAPQAPQGPLRTPEDVQSRAGMFAKEPLTRAQQFTVDAPNMIEATLRQIGGNIKAPFVAANDYLNNPNQPSIAESWSKSGAKIGVPEYQTTSAEAGPKSYDIVTDPFSGEVMVNPEQFLTAEEAQAKAEKEKYAGMTYDQMQMAMAQERTQLADNAQAASTASPAAPTQPNSFATSQGTATTVGGQDLGEYLRGGQAPVAGQQTPSMTPQAPVSSFEQASLDREARIEQNFGNGRAVSDRERRGTGEMSMEAAVRMAGGDRVKARQMIELQRQGRDPITGAAPKAVESEGLTPYQAISAQQRQQEIDMKVSEGMEKKQAEREVAFNESLTNVRATADAFQKLEPVAREIASLSGGAFTQGTLGWVASKLPMSTDARQIERLGKELEGTTFLQGLIEAKAKGATFGALSEREGDRILAARGKLLDPSSTNEQRISAVNDMMSTIQKSMERAKSDHKTKYSDVLERSGGEGFIAPANSATYSDGSSYELI